MRGKKKERGKWQKGVEKKWRPGKGKSQREWGGKIRMLEVKEGQQERDRWMNVRKWAKNGKKHITKRIKIVTIK